MDQAALLALEYPEGAKALEVQEISPERRAVYARLLPKLGSGELKGVLCDAGGEKVQHLVHAADGSPEVVVVEEGCKIMLEDLSPTQMVEYKFKEYPEWFVGYMGEEAMEGYRNEKFKVWRKMIDEPSCKAAFRRLLHSGLVNRLYDATALPTPAHDEESWTVVNEATGKPINIPHPVQEMRIWDASAGAYRTLSPILVGAPSDADAEKYWNQLLVEQREKHGDEMIDEILAEK